MADLETRISRAVERRDSLQKLVDAIDAKYAARHWTELDSATGSGIRRKPDAKKGRARFDAYAKESELRLSLDAAVVEVERLERQAEDSLRDALRVRLTRDDVAGATHIRTRFGWHKVARVNKTTVSVETGYSWTDRYPFDEIHEARAL